jgi:hypothetical protein
MEVVAASRMNILETILLILLGGGHGLPPGTPPSHESPLAANVAPAEFLFYASWAGTATPQASSSNQTEQLLAEPEIQKFLASHRLATLDLIRQLIIPLSNGRATADDVRNAHKLTEFVLGKPGAVYLTELDLKRGGMSGIKGAALVQLDDKADETQKWIAEWQARWHGGNVPTVKIGEHKFYKTPANERMPAIAWGVVEKHLVVGVGDGALEDLLARIHGQSPAWLKDIREKLAVPRFASVACVDAKRLVQIATEAASPSGTTQAVAALGLDKLGRFAVVNGLDGRGCVSRVSLTIDGKGEGLFAGLDVKPLTATDLKPMRDDVLAAVTFKLDAGKLFDLWLKTLDDAGSQSGNVFRREMQQLGSHLGFDFRKEFVGAFGDTWRVFIQPVGPGSLIRGWTFAVSVRDPKSLAQVQKIIVEEWGRQLARGNPSQPTLISGRKFDGHNAYTLDFAQMGLPFAPSWCLTDDTFLLATSPEALVSLFAPSDRPSLAKQPDVSLLVANDAKTLAMGYVNAREITETLLPKLPELLQGINGRTATIVNGRVQAAQNVATDASKLPSSKAFLPHLQPSVLSVARTTDGLEFTSRQTLPGSNVVAFAPVLTAWRWSPFSHLPRQEMQPAPGNNQLKQIGLALHNFAQANRVFPAGYSADANGKPLLSWRVYVLPYLGEDALYREFHLDEPWDSPHNKALIARMPPIYRSPRSKAKPGLTNYLGAAGADGMFVRPSPGSHLGTSFANIVDGTSNTIMTVETPDASAVIWTKPGDFALNKQDPKKRLMGLVPGGFNAGFADGSVRFIPESVNSKILHALFTKSGREAVPMNW